MNAQPAIKRRIGFALAVVCAALLNSGCATGQDAQTANEVPAIDGTSGGVGSIQLHAVAIKSPPGGASYHSGDAAELQLVLVNTGHASDTLRDVSSPAASALRVFAGPAAASAAISPSASSASPGSGSVTSSGAAAASTVSTAPASSTSASGSTASSAPESLAVPPGQALSLGVTSTDQVLLLHLTKDLFSGTSIPITFSFANAGNVTLVVPVQLTESGSQVGVSVPPPSGSTGG